LSFEEHGWSLVRSLRQRNLPRQQTRQQQVAGAAEVLDLALKGGSLFLKRFGKLTELGE
jgi:hypothetical protein